MQWLPLPGTCQGRKKNGGSAVYRRLVLDLFAKSRNNKLSLYISPVPNPNGVKEDAIHHSRV